jgi:hypothetical protein
MLRLESKGSPFQSARGGLLHQEMMVFWLRREGAIFPGKKSIGQG